MKPSGCMIGDRKPLNCFLGNRYRVYRSPKSFWQNSIGQTGNKFFFSMSRKSRSIDKTILDHLKSKLLVLEVSNPLYTIRNLNQRLEGNAKPAAIGFQLPIIETMEEHLGLAAELGELIGSGNCMPWSAGMVTPSRFRHGLPRTSCRRPGRMFQADFISCPPAAGPSTFNKPRNRLRWSSTPDGSQNCRHGLCG